MSTDPNAAKSTGTLLSEALTQVSGLLRKEVDLARAEIDENLSTAGVAIGMILGGAIIALTALNVLAAALVTALTEAGLQPGWSALIVGVVLAVIAFALLSKGVGDLKLSRLAPNRTAKNVQRDAKTIKEVYDDK
jgi:hypothetical protein